MNDNLLFYNEYEQFYKFAETSEVFRQFCVEAYGADFSQDGFSDINQINMILAFIREPSSHILDIGCGNGKMLKYIQKKTGAQIHGFDYSENAVMQAKEGSSNGDFRVGVIGEIDYPRDSFDVIVSMDSIYFANDMGAFLTQVKSWLKPGGVFFVAYQEGDVMEKTEDAHTTSFAKAMKEIGWEYSVKDITEESFAFLQKKRETAKAYIEHFRQEGNGMWGDMLIDQTDYILQGKEAYMKNLARYIYIAEK